MFELKVDGKLVYVGEGLPSKTKVASYVEYNPGKEVELYLDGSLAKTFDDESKVDAIMDILTFQCQAIVAWTDWVEESSEEHYQVCRE